MALDADFCEGYYSTSKVTVGVWSRVLCEKGVAALYCSVNTWNYNSKLIIFHARSMKAWETNAPDGLALKSPKVTPF